MAWADPGGQGINYYNNYKFIIIELQGCRNRGGQGAIWPPNVRGGGPDRVSFGPPPPKKKKIRGPRPTTVHVLHYRHS